MLRRVVGVPLAFSVQAALETASTSLQDDLDQLAQLTAARSRHITPGAEQQLPAGVEVLEQRIVEVVRFSCGAGKNVSVGVCVRVLGGGASMLRARPGLWVGLAV